MSRISARLTSLWALLLVGAAAALLIAWLAHAVSVPLATLLTVATVVVGLSWLIVLVTLPWNLYFAARRALIAMAVSRERGISVRQADESEARQLAARMLVFAVGGHVGTALVAAVIAWMSASKPGYYVAGLFLLSTVFRPAAGYFLHVRERIRTLTHEGTHPRDDVATIKRRVDKIVGNVHELRHDLRATTGDLRRVESRLTDEVGHARQLLSSDLARLTDMQAADRAAARADNEELGHRIDEMVRRIQATLDGLGDQQELLTGLRALVRMVRADQG